MKLYLKLVLLALGLLLGALGWNLTGSDAQAARGWRTANWHTARVVAAQQTNVIVVNSTADGTLAALAGNTTCDLREAIEAANFNVRVGRCPAGMMGADTITFAPGVTGTIALTAGELFIRQSLTIQGPSAPVLAVSGNNQSRVFYVAAPVRLSGLTITGGNGDGDLDTGNGGGIWSDGTLTITDSHITGNTASGGGGGINSRGRLTIERSAVTGNTANKATQAGGGIQSFFTLTVINSTVSGNRATGASGLNTGGIWSVNTATIQASTITDNEAAGPSSAGGVLAAGGAEHLGNTITVSNTIIAANRNNTVTPDVRSVTFNPPSPPGAFISQGYNLIGNPGVVTAFNQTGDQVGTMAAPLNPALGLLVNNGGPTPTHRPVAGSPTIDKGNSFGLTIDQRGFPRPQDNPGVTNATGGDGSDIGAVENFTDTETTSTFQLVVDPATDPVGAAQELITALILANEAPNPTTIKLHCGTYTLTRRHNTFYGFTGLPIISTPVTIEGNGAVVERSSTAGTPSFRLFAIARAGDLDPATGAVLSAGNLTLTGVTLRGGLAQGGAGGDSDGDSGGGGGAGLGGAIFNGGTLTVQGSTLTQNTAQGGRAGSFISLIEESEGGGGGGLGGNGGASPIDTNGGSGGGGFGGQGGVGTPGSTGDAGGGGGGTISDGSQGSGTTGGAGGTLNGGRGGDKFESGSLGGFGGGGGGGGGNNGLSRVGGTGGIGGGGGGGGLGPSPGGAGGFGGGGGGAASGGGSGGAGGAGGFGGGGGGGQVGGAGGGGGGAGGSNFSAGGGGGAGLGGAIFNDGGTLTLINSTLSGNAAQGGAGGTGRDGGFPEGSVRNGAPGRGLGGGLFARNGTVTINHATFNLNSVTDGAGATVANGGGSLYLLGDATIVRTGDPTSVTFNVANSIFANTPGGVADALVGTLNTGTLAPGTNNNNLVEVNGTTSGADSNDLPGVTQTADPQLGPLTAPSCAAGGCLAHVHTITTASPAHNAAGNNTEALDKCGTVRPQGTASDLGAFEVVLVCATLTLNPAGPTLPNGTTGVAYTQTFTSPNGFGAIALSLATGTLPPGLQLNGATLSGTPTLPGLYNFTLTATDANGCTGSQAYTLTINCPIITATVSGGGLTCPGGAATVAVNLTGGTAPYTVTLSDGQSKTSSTLPLIFTVNPATTTTYTVTAARDAYQCAATVTGSATVTVDSTAPTLGAYPTPGPLKGGAGTTVTPDQPPADNLALGGVTVAAPGFTGTLSVNPTTGAVTISNANPGGTFTVTVTATDQCGAMTSRSFALTVDTTAPTLSCQGNQAGVSNGTSGPVSYIAPTVSDNLPGATFSCTPASGANFALGTTTVTCTATDAVGNTSAACSFTLTVRQPRPALKDLIAKVRALVPATLTTAQANGLIGQLELANTSLERGQTAPACTHLANFVNAVGALTGGGSLTTAQGASLTRYANQIRNAIGCAGSPFAT